jgi:zeaxanthin glucosyltransferase
MAIIAFLMDNKEGHIIPSFGLAGLLKNRGHHIIYLGIIDNEVLVSQQGFAFYPVFENIYPKGFHQANKKSREVTDSNPAREKAHILGIVNGALDTFFGEFNPDLFIISAFLSLESLLLYYKYNIRPVVLTTYLRERDSTLTTECLGGILDFPAEVFSEIADCMESLGAHFISLMELVQPLETFYELILCPSELNMDIEPGSRDARTYHLGPTIYQDKKLGVTLDMDMIKEKKKIVYASMGSYAVTYGKDCNAFFCSMVNMIRNNRLPDIHLVLSVGLEFDMSLLEPLPENLTVVRWVSQTELLKDVAVVITHGGLGTIKESIYYGVPMIVFPMGYDQARNATLVEHHKLGLKREIGEITENSLVSDICHLLTDSRIHDNVKKMKRIFREKEDAQIGVQVIENLLTRGQGIF